MPLLFPEDSGSLTVYSGKRIYGQGQRAQLETSRVKARLSSHFTWKLSIPDEQAMQTSPEPQFPCEESRGVNPTDKLGTR